MAIHQLTCVTDICWDSVVWFEHSVTGQEIDK